MPCFYHIYDIKYINFSHLLNIYEGKGPASGDPGKNRIQLAHPHKGADNRPGVRGRQHQHKEVRIPHKEARGGREGKGQAYRPGPGGMANRDGEAQGHP